MNGDNVTAVTTLHLGSHLNK